MWNDVELETLSAQENAGTPTWTSEQLEELVRLTRLELYNRNLPCGATALRNRLALLYPRQPLPSVRTIGRILARHGLTRGRTGCYPGDDPEPSRHVSEPEPQITHHDPNGKR